MAEGNGSLFQVFPVAKSPERRARPVIRSQKSCLNVGTERFIQALDTKPAASEWRMDRLNIKNADMHFFHIGPSSRFSESTSVEQTPSQPICSANCLPSAPMFFAMAAFSNSQSTRSAINTGFGGQTNPLMPSLTRRAGSPEVGTRQHRFAIQEGFDGYQAIIFPNRTENNSQCSCI